MNTPILSDDYLFVTHEAFKHELIHSLPHEQHIIVGLGVLSEFSLSTN